MNEQEWLACDDPAKMLDYLMGKRAYGKAGSRVMTNLPEDRIATDRQLRLWVEACRELTDREWGWAGGWPADLDKELASCSVAWASGFRNVIEIAPRAALLRDIFGNPWKPVASLYRLAKLDNSGWSGLKKIPAVDWLTPTVLALARAVHDGRAFGRMPVLADALEEAGCADEAVLSHCRGAGPHCRGCWVIDLILEAP